MPSLWLRFLDETSKIVLTVTASACLYTRSAAVCYFAVGGVACSISAKLVKDTIRQQRPEQGRKTTYGMPSSHASTCTFFAVSVLLGSVYLPLHSSLHPLAVYAPLVVVPWTGMIVLSRVWLGYHTWLQVVGGVVFGVFFGMLWFKIWVQDIGGVATFGREMETELHTVTSHYL